MQIQKPMASTKDFVVSAPAKVIMYGEHAVVHGKASIAAALSLRSFLHVAYLSEDDSTITLDFADVNLKHTWNIDDLPWDEFNTPGKKKKYTDTVTSLDKDLVEALDPHVGNMKSKVAVSAAKAFLYTYLMLSSRESRGFIYTMRSTIPISSGLGSSASVSVCLSTALQMQAGTLKPPSAELTEAEMVEQLKRINDWAFVGEMCIHGNPSGVDNTVSTGGKAVCFRRGNYNSPPSVMRLDKFPELPLLLINTNQARSTAELVSGVHQLKNSHPTATALMLDAIDSVTTEAMAMLNNEFFRADESHLLRLGELTRINHGLLVSLGVSHPKLERIRQLVDGKGIGWTKLTGAGGGGCAMTILKERVLPEEMRGLEADLKAEGFTKYRTTLGGDGVGLLFPTPKMDISRETLIAATNSEEIESLMGIRSIGTGKRGWGFWRKWTSDEEL